MMYDAAIRQISEKGLNPSQVTYEQVTEGIQRIKKKGKQLNDWLSNTSRLLDKMEAQKEIQRCDRARVVKSFHVGQPILRHFLRRVRKGTHPDDRIVRVSVSKSKV